LRGKALSFLTREKPLLLGGGHQHAVFQQTAGGIVIAGGNAENVHARDFHTPLKISRLAVFHQ